MLLDAVVTHLCAGDVAELARYLLSSERVQPVVAVTTDPKTGRYWIEPRALSDRVGEWADVVALETWAATRGLKEALPDGLDVFNGAMRIWLPGLDQASDRYDHPLYLVRSEEEAERRVAELENNLQRSFGSPPGSPKETSSTESESTPHAIRDIVKVAVVSTSAGILVQDADGVVGRLTGCDQHKGLTVCLREGQELLIARPQDWTAEQGEMPCLLHEPIPSPWKRIAEDIKEGDVVEGCVVFVHERYALVDLLPGATGKVHLAEIDHTFVHDISEFLKVGELVAVQILELDVSGEKAQLSVKAAQLALCSPRPLPSLLPGGKPFEWQAYLELSGIPYTEPRDKRDALIENLQVDLNTEQKLRKAQDRVWRKKYRALKARYDNLERSSAGDSNPFADEQAFLRAVREEYGRKVCEGERHDYPLLPMRVGPEFLKTARKLQGISATKIVQVAAQVACKKAHEIAGREVHALRESGSKSKQRVRTEDNAKKWRCALQINTPAARRLHYWLIPGPEGETVEFASVGLHGDESVLAA